MEIMRFVSKESCTFVEQKPQNTTIMLSQEELKQISEKGISEEQLLSQLEQFKEGFPFLRLEAPAAIGKGIMAPDAQQRQAYHPADGRHCR